MAVDPARVLNEIDDVLADVQRLISRSKYDDLSDLNEHGAEAATLLRSAITRYAPPRSDFIKNIGSSTIYGIKHDIYSSIRPLIGILSALRQAYAKGYLTTLTELAQADVFKDFLEMAEHLLENRYKDAAAVIGGSVLEQHLRKLAVKNNIAIVKPDGKAKKAESLNTDLCAMSVYTLTDQKSVTSWLDIRNNAAHGNYDEYTGPQVALLLQSIRDFISRQQA